MKYRKLFIEYSQTTFWKANCDNYNLSLEKLDAVTKEDRPVPDNFAVRGPDNHLAIKFGP